MRDTQGYRFSKKLSPMGEYNGGKERNSTTTSAIISPTTVQSASRVPEDQDTVDQAKQQRRLLMSQEPKARYNGDLRIPYGRILRQQLDPNKDRPVVTPEGAQAWFNVIQVQDKLEDYRQQAEQVIKNANTSLNPYFYNEELRNQHNPGFGYQDKVPRETRTRRRVKVINVMACKQRVLNINEDVGILGYMQRNQLNGQGKLASIAQDRQKKVID